MATTTSPTSPAPSDAPPGTIRLPLTLPTTARTTSTTRPVAHSGTTIELTAADDQRTVAVRVGEQVDLTLDDPALSWSIPTAMPDGLLRPEVAPSPPPQGRRAEWTAVHPGTVTLGSVGVPSCTAPMVCPMYARLFKVTVVIT